MENFVVVGLIVRKLLFTLSIIESAFDDDRFVCFVSFFGINYVLSIRITEFVVDLGLVCICFAFSVYFKIARNSFSWESQGKICFLKY